MSKNNVLFALAVMLLIAPMISLHAKKKEPIAVPSLLKGDPPPGNAMALSVSQARAALKDAIQKRFAGTEHGLALTVIVEEATDPHFSSAGFGLTAPSTAKISTIAAQPRDPGKFSVVYKNVQDYVEPCRLVARLRCGPTFCYTACYASNPDWRTRCLGGYVFDWPDEAEAQTFSDAFNRLVYAAHHHEDEQVFAAFSAAAKAWRENPAKPPLSPEADRERILGENAIKEKDLESAIEHYESALQAQPMWPAGWFNLALIYAEENNYSDATGRMRHYLELAPDAPDAKDAREQMVIWEDKAKQ
ncbi:MAG: tetratricopeptide repeat protein [Terriglobales bacterium]